MCPESRSDFQDTFENGGRSEEKSSRAQKKNIYIRIACRAAYIARGLYGFGKEYSRTEYGRRLVQPTGSGSSNLVDTFFEHVLHLNVTLIDW